MRKAFLLLLILISTFGLSAPAFALGEVYSGGYSASVVSGLKYIISGSPSSTYDNNIIKPAAYDWNFISSKVSLTYNSSGARMSVLVQGDSGNDDFGRMYPYYKDSLGRLRPASTTMTWYCTDVVGYNTTMDDASLDTNEKRQIFCHEMGHALSLDHVSYTHDSIMHPTYTFLYISPQTYDENNIIYKWGS